MSVSILQKRGDPLIKVNALCKTAHLLLNLLSRAQSVIQRRGTTGPKIYVRWRADGRGRKYSKEKQRFRNAAVGHRGGANTESCVPVPGCHANAESLFHTDPGQCKQTEEPKGKETEEGCTDGRAGKRRPEGPVEEEFRGKEWREEWSVDSNI